MSQARLTNYFNVRKKLPDQHAAKRRKVLTESSQQNTADIVISKDAVETDEPVSKKKNINEETTTDVVTSATDEHILAPKTPSTTSSKDAKNTRASKRSSKGEEPTTPNTDKTEDQPIRFTPGSGDSSTSKSAKKKLDMGKGSSTKSRRNVEFTKLSNLSPKKDLSKQGSSMLRSEEFKVPTPVKELIGGRRPRPTRENISKNLFQDDSEPAAAGTSGGGTRQKRQIRAEIETAKQVAKKLTPEEIKARLGTRNKSVDFRAKLKSLIEESNKVGEIKKKEPVKKSITQPLPLLSPSKTGLTVEIPASPTKSLQQRSEVKASPKKVPAYERFAYLTKPVERLLPLPYKYRMLTEVFNCVDNVVSIFFNRNERIVYPKLAKAVQDMMRKNFGDKFLKQIKCVFPQAYFYAWHQVLNKYGQKKEEYELNIEPNLNYKKDILKDLGAEEEERKKGKLTGEMILERKNIFHNSLLQMVKDQHRDFLKTLDPPISVDDAKLTRWHKDFDVESCSEVDTVDLPAKPQVEKIVTAQQVLNKANQIFNLNPKLGESLMDAASKIDTKKNEEDATKDQPSQSTTASKQPEPVLKGLKGLNPKLLEKIRAKEAEKAKLEMTRDHGQIKKLKQLEKLPGLARTARGLFVAERKSSLPIEMVTRKLVESYPGAIDTKVMEEDLRSLHGESEGWFRIQMVRTMEYCIINQAKDINTVCASLENKLKQARE